MPELPEVETVRRSLGPRVEGRRVLAVTVRNRRLRGGIHPGFEEALTGRVIQAARRRAKFLVFDLDDGTRMLAHLGMTGRMVWAPPATPGSEPGAPGKHDHVEWRLDDGSRIVFTDPRRFGMLGHWAPAAATGPGGDGTEPGPASVPDEAHPWLARMGPEPLSADFTPDVLYRALHKRTAPVKTVLMDNAVVVGVGNIYASESLHRVGIRPGRAANRVSRPEAARLHAAILDVLNESIAAGGTTLQDFVAGDGRPGYFVQDLRVYGRAGQPCRACGTPIRQRVLGGRSSFYCPACQR